MDSFLPVLIIVEFIIVMVGAMSAFMPYLTRKTECFGVTVPSAAQNDPQIAQFKRSYRNLMLLGTLLVAAVSAAVLLRIDIDSAAGAWVMIGVVFAVLLVHSALYLKYHAAVKRVKLEQGWGAQASQVAVVSVTGRRDVVSPWWMLLYVAFIVATLVVGVVNYDAMPERIPMHYDFAGNVTDTAAKSVGMLLFAPGTELFMALVLAFAYYSIARSRRQIDASRPEESLEQSRRFTMAWSGFIVGMGVLLMAMFLCMQLNFIGIVPASAIGFIVAAPVVVILAATIFLTVKYGQGGSRVRVTKTAEATVIDRDEDEHWKLGIFYYNPGDPALFVEKRFGVGFTLNFARPLAWIFLGGILAVAAVSIVLSAIATK